MRTSGNGTWLPQIWYLQIFFPYIWRCKTGITSNLKKRTKAISDKMPGIAIPVFFVLMPFAWHCEQITHDLLKPLRICFKNSGKECYSILAAPLIVLIMLFFFALFCGFICFSAYAFAWMAAN